MKCVKTGAIYTVNAECGVIARTGEIELDVDERITDIDDLRRPLHVSGLEDKDLALFLSFAPVNRLGRPIRREAQQLGFLVTASACGEGVILQDEVVETNPRTHLSPHLTELTAGLPYEEVGQFGFGVLHTFAQQMKH